MVEKEENLLKRFKVRQEYIEERVGTEGVAVICWPDGTKDFYELKDTSIRHVGKTDAGKYESDVSPNPWVQYEEDREPSTDSGPSERSPKDDVSSGKDEQEQLSSNSPPIEENRETLSVKDQAPSLSSPESPPGERNEDEANKEGANEPRLSAFRPIDASKSYAGIHLIDNQTNQPKDSDNQEDKPKDPEQAKRTTSNTKWKASVTVSQTRRKKNN